MITLHELEQKARKMGLLLSEDKTTVVTPLYRTEVWEIAVDYENRYQVILVAHIDQAECRRVVHAALQRLEDGGFDAKGN